MYCFKTPMHTHRQATLHIASCVILKTQCVAMHKGLESNSAGVVLLHCVMDRWLHLAGNLMVYWKCLSNHLISY